MTDLCSGFTLGATPPSMDPCTVIDTFFSLWVVRKHGDSVGLPSNYVYTSSGHLLDTREGENLCKELELTWKYPKYQKVISLAPRPAEYFTGPDSYKGNFTRGCILKGEKTLESRV